MKDKKAIHKPKKIEPEKLRDYVEEHPDAYQKEITEIFGCTGSAIGQTLNVWK